MKAFLDIQNFISNNDSIICVKDFAGKVLYQNERCLKLCGEMYKEDRICEKNCMLFLTRDKQCPQRDKGTQYYPCKVIENDLYDIFFLNNGENLVSILYPLKDRLEADMKYFTQFERLTEKEIAIVFLILQKNVNKDICLKLNIKKDTLKSHLKNIYQKLPVEAQIKLKSRQS